MPSDTAKARPFELRSAGPADLPPVLSLLGRSGLPADGLDQALSHFIVAECKGKLIGAIGLELYGSSALLRSAAVEEKWRGSGVGQALVDRALALARERGMKDVYLLTTTAESWFPRFGFERIGRDQVAAGVQTSVEFRSACPQTAAVMRKALP